MDVERECECCGKIFYIKESRIKHGRGRFCSRGCRYKSMPKTKTVTLICPVCGEEFERSKSQIKSKYSFCSSKCAYKARGMGLVKRIISTPYNCYRKPKRICIICGKEYIYKKSSQKFCSKKCHTVFQSINMRGSKNRFYIDGRSKYKRCHRGFEWQYIRKLIYARDNYECQICGKHCQRKEIQAHHIIPYKETQDNSLNNLITLCVSCHGKVEPNYKDYIVYFTNIINKVEMNAEYIEIIKKRLEDKS